ncbi:hypothetical protein R3P38DRAFT_2985664 [Favolaschia claudopus]|uniref:F-box domain-containing protein n=1 Tax=Favolaschia claudopus TaxID=2862362 RepID=A0AAW0AYN2_9AGAR
MIARKIPRELWDNVIDSRRPHSIASLKDLSLVCSAFTPAAQRVLFHKVIVADRRRTSRRTKITAYILARRLVDLILSPSSSHLVSYIRELHVASDNSDCYAILSTIPWNCLRILTLEKISRIPDPAKSSVQNLVRTPSLRRLEISVAYDESEKEVLERLLWILESCAPNLESLALLGCVNREGSIQLPPRPDFPIKLCTLSLTSCKGLEPLLLRIFDLTSLQNLQCVNSWTPNVESLLDNLGSSIEHIIVSPEDPELQKLDLCTTFPALTAITATCLPCLTTPRPVPGHVARGFPPRQGPSSFNAMLDGLSQHSINNISRIIFRTDGYRFEAQSLALWHKKSIAEFEDLALTQHAMTLRRVEVEVNIEHYFESDEVCEQLYDVVRTAFPRLHEKGLLFVYLLDGYA